MSGGAPCPLESTDGVCQGKIISADLFIYFLNFISVCLFVCLCCRQRGRMICFVSANAMKTAWTREKPSLDTLTRSFVGFCHFWESEFAAFCPAWQQCHSLLAMSLFEFYWLDFLVFEWVCQFFVVTEKRKEWDYNNDFCIITLWTQLCKWKLNLPYCPRVVFALCPPTPFCPKHILSL